MTHDPVAPNANAPDPSAEGWLFGAPPEPVPAVVLPLAPPSRVCELFRSDPRAFYRIRHADEVKTTTVGADGITRMTWTCRACGSVRGRA